MEARVTCPHCRYDWEPRTPEPKKCPLCGKWLDKSKWEAGWTCPDCGREYVEVPVWCLCHDNDENNEEGEDAN